MVTRAGYPPFPHKHSFPLRVRISSRDDRRCGRAFRRRSFGSPRRTPLVRHRTSSVRRRPFLSPRTTIPRLSTVDQTRPYRRSVHRTSITLRSTFYLVPFGRRPSVVVIVRARRSRRRAHQSLWESTGLLLLVSCSSGCSGVFHTWPLS